jgi:phosphotriesterase-related protein
MTPSPHVQSVTGPVPAHEIGLADAHSHLWIEAVRGADPAAPRLDDEDLILRRLETYAEAGGQAIVDCQPAGCGRNANRLRRLSATSGIKVIACTGFHRQRYYDSEYPLWRMTAGQAHDFFVGEAEQGLDETHNRPEPVLPGFIKIAAEQTLADSPQALFEAAAAACLVTGLAIEMHTERGAGVERFLTFFDDQGVPPERLVFCHVDKRPDFGLHRELAQAGVLLEYDTFLRPKYEPDHNVWPLLWQMIAAGLSASLALATDMAESATWHGPGPAAFINDIGGRLEREEIDPAQRRKLMGSNIIGRLAIRQEPEPVDLKPVVEPDENHEAAS